MPTCSGEVSTCNGVNADLHGGANDSKVEFWPHLRVFRCLHAPNSIPSNIIPSVFDKRVAEAVAHEVEEAAYATHVARRNRAAQEGI